MWLRVWLACGLALPLPLSAVTSQSFQVSATVTPGCLIVGGGSNYGALTYGSYSALATSTVTAALTGGVTLQCTPGVALSMSVDGGLHSGSGRNLQLNSGSARVPYQLFRDAAFSQSLGISQSVSVSYSDANTIRLPIYGRVVLPGNQPGGTYSDTLQVQLSW
ncbi:spore coat protein U domain-containing protein [Pseudomonas fluorescens]|jgi:spore coat protein U-like protein|uniref:SCPU domain-containing protein n=1 Tax=Pseudomonas fluorescens TaxID=294 RepID=A0A2N1E631_PSEFL|nr:MULTISPECIES: spore coat U domain-containing protein [Pseudomonas]MBD8097207.1 spore coat protein U domain-containing protein [Pseudomonas fluorescens]MBD8773181.1 spore coat protein U domain-containing protein [Pseudomonas fluorescens]MBD8777513.1 spore coat protein U domain-containing protein [Pseudomonas fluorescens]MBD8794115.1 spore coat protein U domain-containing protein [Pseudomonas fluorescens]PKH20406.1 SCPU domain-containing protein [Pseudomonas fluorescens]